MSVSHLEQAFSTFKYQLSALLGVPALPSSITSLDKKGMSPWQLDAILRRRALENVQDSAETLQSIVKLVDKIENMPVKEDVRGDILEALAAFEMVTLIYDPCIELLLSFLFCRHTKRPHNLHLPLCCTLAEL